MFAAIVLDLKHTSTWLWPMCSSGHARCKINERPNHVNVSTEVYAATYAALCLMESPVAVHCPEPKAVFQISGNDRRSNGMRLVGADAKPDKIIDKPARVEGYKGGRVILSRRGGCHSIYNGHVRAKDSCDSWKYLPVLSRQTERQTPVATFADQSISCSEAEKPSLLVRVNASEVVVGQGVLAASALNAISCGDANPIQYLAKSFSTVTHNRTSGFQGSAVGICLNRDFDCIAHAFNLPTKSVRNKVGSFA